MVRDRDAGVSRAQVEAVIVALQRWPPGAGRPGRRPKPAWPAGFDWRVRYATLAKL
jgi:hypothetical protein